MGGNMNAKELREAAQRLIDNVRLWEADHLDLDLVEIADHVLATVRDDDDEHVNKDWAHQSCCDFAAYLQCDCCDDGIWLRGIETRSEVRSLCRGLGVELKEGGQ